MSMTMPDRLHTQAKTLMPSAYPDAVSDARLAYEEAKDEFTALTKFMKACEDIWNKDKEAKTLGKAYSKAWNKYNKSNKKKG